QGAEQQRQRQRQEQYRLADHEILGGGPGRGGGRLAGERGVEVLVDPPEQERQPAEEHADAEHDHHKGAARDRRTSFGTRGHGDGPFLRYGCHEGMARKSMIKRVGALVKPFGFMRRTTKDEGRKTKPASSFVKEQRL